MLHQFDREILIEDLMAPSNYKVYPKRIRKAASLPKIPRTTCEKHETASEKDPQSAFILNLFIMFYKSFIYYL